MKAEDQDAGLIFASTTKDDSSPSGQTGDTYPIPKAGIGSSPRFAAARAAEATFERAIQFQRRELVAVPALQMIMVCRRCGQKQKPRRLGGRRGSGVERRRNRCQFEGLANLAATAGAATHATGTATALGYGVVGGGLEEGRVGFGTGDIGQLSGGGTATGIGSLYHHGDLQVGGHPGFLNNLNGLSIADLAGGDGARDTGTGGLHTIDGLHGESLGDGVGIGAGRARDGVGAVAGSAARERTASGVAVWTAAETGTNGHFMHGLGRSEERRVGEE